MISLELNGSPLHRLFAGEQQAFAGSSPQDIKSLPTQASAHWGWKPATLLSSRSGMDPAEGEVEAFAALAEPGGQSVLPVRLGGWFHQQQVAVGQIEGQGGDGPLPEMGRRGLPQAVAGTEECASPRG